MPQRFYNVYLAKRIKDSKPHVLTDAWLSLDDPATTREQLPEASRKEPLDVLKDTNADLPLVSKCLEAHIAAMHSGKDTKMQLKAAYSSQKVGMRALQWMLESKAYDKYDLLLASDFFKVLAHSMVAQNAEEYIWSFLHTEHVPSAVRRNLPHTMWKGILLRQLVWARMFRSADKQASSSGMQAFRRALVPSKEQRLERPELFISLASAGVALAGFLHRVESRFITVEDCTTSN